jgi:CotH kinase protein/Lamin Tail Domain/Secretion system C-terminal sorting domain/Chitobiase/beta-hexosaminidase C-terminal domain
MRVCLLFIMFLLSTIFCLAQDVVINEVCYSNKTILVDSHGDTPDWIEIYNSTSNPVDITGYKITDDTSKSTYWTIPEHILGPQDYLIIFASDKDTVLNGELHTGFKLGIMVETVFLMNSAGDIIDEIKPQCAPVNFSISRVPDGSGQLAVTEPSPGTTNNHSPVIEVTFLPDTLLVDHNSGFYGNPISVTLSKLHEGNIIKYTLDGDIPNEESDEFGQPIYLEDLTSQENRFANKAKTLIEPGNNIFKANILRAVVYSNGCPASNEICNTYFINEALKHRYDVPVISLITEEDNLFDDEIGIYTHGNYRNFDQHGSEWERLTHVEIFDTSGIQIIDQDAGMRIHGRGSRRSDQKSLRLYAETEYGKEYFEYPFFSQKPDLDKFRVLLVRTTGGNFGTLFKEELCNALVQEMNIDYPAGETAILFINGEYWGIYNLMERQNKFYVEDNYNIRDTDVDIIAYDYNVVVEEGSMDDYNMLIQELTIADPSSETFFNDISTKIDIDAIIDYYIAHLYLANTDWPQSNVELWKLKSDTARWRYFFFDSDASMEWQNEDHLTEYNNDIDDYQRYDDFCTIILKTLLNNKTFRELFFARFYNHMSTTFSADRVINTVTHFEKLYAPMVPEQIYRWHNPGDYFKWQKKVDWLKTYALQRPLMIMEQLKRNFGNPFVIYPNPSNGMFFLNLLVSTETVHIKICSMKGDYLYESTFPVSQNTVIPIHTGLPPGMYLIQVRTDHQVFTDKIIIQ